MNRQEKAQFPNRTTEEWLEFVERYFEATLSNKEEHELRLFLASDAASSPLFDEAKAVISYIATSKVHKKSKPRRNAIIREFIRYSAAAAIVIATSIGLWHHNSIQEEVYIAYIDGKQYTDQATVLSQMYKAIAHVSCNTQEYSAQQQLSEIFGTLNNKSKDIEIRTE